MADLIDASRKGDVGKLKTILKKGTVTNFRNKDNSTALHLASSNGKTQAVELLLAQVCQFCAEYLLILIPLG